MKILFDNQIFGIQKYGGVSRYHIELAKQYTDRFGDTVAIPAWFVRNEYLANYLGKSPLDFQNNRIIRSINRLNTINTFLKLYLKKPDVVHLTWYNPRIVKACRRRKMVITVHDMIQEIYGLDPEAVENKRNAMQKADGIIAISESTKKDILRFCPEISKDKIKVIYHGTNHLGEPVRPSTFQLPSRYILYVGTRNSYKNADFLMEALSEKLRTDSNLYLLFIGGGAFSDEEEMRLNELGIRSKVIQQSVSDAELAYIYKNAICFVYPSMYEGFGFPILEAFDNECPVLCNNTSSLPEVGGEAAMYFSPGNSEELAEKVNMLISDANLRKQYIERGAERIKRFSWEKTAEDTRAFYKKIIIE